MYSALLIDTIFVTFPDIIGQWEVLEKLAVERQKQSKDLSEIYNDLMSVKSVIHDVTAASDHSCFEDVTDLESTIKQLQVKALILIFLHSYVIVWYVWKGNKTCHFSLGCFMLNISSGIYILK